MAAEERKEAPEPFEWERHKPFGAIILTILAMLAWLVFILLYALYWSSGFSLFQNVIVTIVTLVMTALVIGLGWIIWGFRHAGYWREWAKRD